MLNAILVFVETTVIKHAPTDIMGNNVFQNANVTVHSSAIMCVDAYKGQIQRTTSQPTTQKLYPRILSKPVFLLLTPALKVQVGIMYLDNDDDDNEQKFDKINIDVVSSYSAETCSKDTSTDSTGCEKTYYCYKSVLFLVYRMKGDVKLYYFKNLRLS